MKSCLAILLLLVLGIAGLIVWVDRPLAPVASTYQDALISTSAEKTAWLTRDTPEESAAFDRFRDFWSDLTPERVTRLLPAVYDESVWFNDTVKTITNQSDLLTYMIATANHVDSCRVEVKDIAATDEGYYIRWVMSVVPGNAKPGTEWTSIGMTHLRFNAEGQVVLHQDYWDSAAGLYEHFPLIGWAIRNIKARL